MGKYYKNKRDRDGEGEEYARQKEAAAIRLGRTKAAMQMRIDGMDYAMIASELGYGTAEAAARDVHEALEEEFLNNGQYSTEILRMIELKRLNTLYNALLPGIQRGNSRSVDVAVKISDRIAKMSGLDAAQRLEVVELQHVDAEIARLRNAIAERGGRAELESPVIDVELDD